MFIYRAGEMDKIVGASHTNEDVSLKDDPRSIALDKLNPDFWQDARVRRTSFFATPFLSETLRWADMKNSSLKFGYRGRSLSSKELGECGIWKISVDAAELKVFSVHLYDVFTDYAGRGCRYLSPDAKDHGLQYWLSGIPLESFMQHVEEHGLNSRYSEVLFRPEDVKSYSLVDPDELDEASYTLGNSTYSDHISFYKEVFPLIEQREHLELAS